MLTVVPPHAYTHAHNTQVRTRDEQVNVMVEALQNHTPAVLVVDEIGRLQEVRAARTCKV